MNNNITRFFYKTAAKIKKGSPIILAVMASVGVVGTTVLAVKGTIKARDEYNSQKESLDVYYQGRQGCPHYNNYEELEWSKKTKAKFAIKTCWKFYIPTVVVGTATIGCIVGSTVLSKKQQNSLAAAYAALSSQFAKYKKEIDALYGDGTAVKVGANIARKKFESTSESFIDGLSDDIQLFYEHHADAFIQSTLAEVIEAEYELNRLFVLQGYATLGDFYILLGVPEENIPENAHLIGWCWEAGCNIYGYQWIDFEHRDVEMEDGMKFVEIRTPFEPENEFMDSYI